MKFYNNRRHPKTYSVISYHAEYITISQIMIEKYATSICRFLWMPEKNRSLHIFLQIFFVIPFSHHNRVLHSFIKYVGDNYTTYVYWYISKAEDVSQFLKCKLRWMGDRNTRQKISSCLYFHVKYTAHKWYLIYWKVSSRSITIYFNL